MLVTEYDARFTKLSRHAIFLIPIKADKVRWFMMARLMISGYHGTRVSAGDYFSSSSRDSSEDRACSQQE